MEPNKLDTDFQNILNQREINPSTNSWDKLETMLVIAEEKKSEPSYDWMYIAASIIGFVFVGILFFSQTKELVDVRRNNVVLENKKIIIPLKNTKQEQTQTLVLRSDSTQSIVVISKVKKINDNPVTSILKSNKQNQVVQNSSGNIQNSMPVVVQVEELITDVESPLKSAILKPSVKVDARNLLSQVDGELDVSFREKVITTIDKNYKTVKLALANRNQE